MLDLPARSSDEESVGSLKDFVVDDDAASDVPDDQGVDAEDETPAQKRRRLAREAEEEVEALREMAAEAARLEAAGLGRAVAEDGTRRSRRATKGKKPERFEDKIEELYADELDLEEAAEWASDDDTTAVEDNDEEEEEEEEVEDEDSEFQADDEEEDDDESEFEVDEDDEDEDE